MASRSKTQGSRLVITSLPRSKCLLISWLKSPSAVILAQNFLFYTQCCNVGMRLCNCWRVERIFCPFRINPSDSCYGHGPEADHQIDKKISFVPRFPAALHLSHFSPPDCPGIKNGISYPGYTEVVPLSYIVSLTWRRVFKIYYLKVKIHCVV